MKPAPLMYCLSKSQLLPKKKPSSVMTTAHETAPSTLKMKKVRQRIPDAPANNAVKTRKPVMKRATSTILSPCEAKYFSILQQDRAGGALQHRLSRLHGVVCRRVGNALANLFHLQRARRGFVGSRHDA